jgi:F0F1-type ATP synthase delta subunit
MSLSRKLATYLIEGKATLDDVIDLLVKYKLLTLLPLIKGALVQMAASAHVKSTLMIESPFDLSLSSIKKIQGIVGNESSPYEVTINKKVLAGFKAKYKGMMYDGSAERIIKQISNLTTNY